MITKTIGIIGGMYKQQHIKKIEEKYAVKVISNDGRSVRKKALLNIANQVDCLVIVRKFCGHEAMYGAKEAANNTDTPIIFPLETNMDKIIQSGMAALI
ncbi:DUF2325 domain-containing protein [Lysinibacillus xylanilyticus]|uniref:DUF2325 domain-containing protein n=1 Tax=Lysinibacillus TaxID=400634 RepID=UPI002B255ACE|nr:DUF2325 domain-containing protein [Lysinibacillus xylanilyticus]MEB2301539.1 DUF2325 domain-containing protein [Lysinibacillus xylanilyticus]